MGLSEGGHVVFYDPSEAAIVHWSWSQLNSLDSSVHIRGGQLRVSDIGDVFFFGDVIDQPLANELGNAKDMEIEAESNSCLDEENFYIAEGTMLAWNPNTSLPIVIEPTPEILDFAGGDGTCGYRPDFDGVRYSPDGSLAYTDRGHRVEISGNKVNSASEVDMNEVLWLNNAGDVVERVNGSIHLNGSLLSLNDVAYLDAAGSVLGNSGNNIMLYRDSQMNTLFAGGIARGFGVLDGQMIVLTDSHAHFQKKDPISGQFVSINQGNAFYSKSIEELLYPNSLGIINPDWTDLSPEGISENGQFIVVSGIFNGNTHLGILLKVDLEEVEGTNEDGELKIRGNVAVDGVFDRISISRDVAGFDVELDGMAYSGGDFEFTLDQTEDILRIDSLSRILSPENFDLKVSLEISGNVVASVDLPVEISTEETSGSDTYSQWYGDQNTGGAVLVRIFFPMRLDETYVSVKYGNLVHKGRTNYLYYSYFESNFVGGGPAFGQPTMNVGHRYVGPTQEHPIGMTVSSAIIGPNTQSFEARTDKWVNEDYMDELSHGEGLVNLTFSGMNGPVPWIPPLDRTVESPDQNL